MTLYDDGPFSWMNHSACKDMDPEKFFPSATGAKSQKQTIEAQQVCAGCPVQAACNAYKERFGGVMGVWGGENHYSKNATGLSGAGQRAARLVGRVHGTDAGYAQHYYYKEKPCHDCRVAHNRKWTPNGTSKTKRWS